MNKIHLKIATPEKLIYEDEVNQVSFMTPDGQITILPDHIPLITVLAPGEILIKKNNEEISIACYGGFIDVRLKNQIMVLADAAERIEELEEKKIEEAKKKAEELLKIKKGEEVDFAEARAALEKEMARLKIARKWAERKRKLKIPTTEQ